MAAGPAGLAGCNQHKGQVAAGYDADLIVFDPEEEFQVTAERLRYRHPLSPYVGETLCGAVKATYLRGHLVFARGEFPGEPCGREWRR
jgi:allantoinase